MDILTNEERAELGLPLTQKTHYAVAHHGTAGLGWSYGYAEVVAEGEQPRADQTTTIVGPMTKEQAERQAATWNEECDRYRAERDGR